MSENTAENACTLKGLVELDHLLWIAPDLDAGVAEFEALTGVQAVPGGSHETMGTRNALVALDGGAYLEILAPDPEQRLEGSLGARLAASASGAWTYAVRTADLAGVTRAASARRLSTAGPVGMTRRTADGRLLEWEVAYAGEEEFGAAAPFYIDWLRTPHPADTLPHSGLALESLSVASPRPDELSAFYRSIGLDVLVIDGAPGIEITLRTPRGSVPIAVAGRAPGLRANPVHMFRVGA